MLRAGLELLEAARTPRDRVRAGSFGRAAQRIRVDPDGGRRGEQRLAFAGLAIGIVIEARQRPTQERDALLAGEQRRRGDRGQRHPDGFEEDPLRQTQQARRIDRGGEHDFAPARRGVGQ
ncbi:MAG: hypothetical protein MUF70_14985 [Myxococcota bacterium]|nr:hypothetical protein [Myxococcota bacterium]